MTAATATATRQSAVPDARLSAAGLLRSEWTKLRSLRSTVWSYVVAVLLVVGLSAVICVATANHWSQMDPQERAHLDPTQLSVAGGFLAQLAIGVLGVLLISGEYSTGMIRSTMSAVPKRLPALWAKVAIFTVVTFVSMAISAVVAFLFGQKLLRSTGRAAAFGQPDVNRAVLGVALYLTVVGLLGMGLGALLRHSAGAISALVGVLLVLPIIVNFLPSNWQEHVHKYLPGEAGQQVLITVRDAGGQSLSPWVGFSVFLGYAVLVMALAAVLLKRRDV